MLKAKEIWLLRGSLNSGVIRGGCFTTSYKTALQMWHFSQKLMYNTSSKYIQTNWNETDLFWLEI